MKHYNYTTELGDVFAQLKEVKETRKHEKLYAEKNTPESHKTVLRRAYKNALRAALINLTIALDKWMIDGCKIEEDDKEINAE